MAFGERLVQNNAAWKVHIDGLTEMLNQRYERGERFLPPWLYEMVISDATNYVLGFPRWYHPQLAQVICKYGLPAISDIEKMCSALVEVLKSIDEVQAALPSQTSGLKELEIDRRVRDILRQARALRANDTPCVCITATTVELILSLSWPQHDLAVEGAATAEEMRQALGRFCVRPCCYADLTSGYLMIGAIAADEGSETRQWFISRLKDSLASVRADGSPIDTTEALKAEFVDKVGSMLYSNVLWNDIFAG
ncbi:hypothetical protein E8E14_012738 [Neopestalotiopsis sp. 37M]|nr:hypothetical protein E8E14_012738 [Neopestalotiopsis sp. 37M]